MKKYRDGALCHRCNKGHLVSNDADQHCDYCGRIFYTDPGEVHFRDLTIGERFYSSYRPDELLVKISDCHPRDGSNYAHADNPQRGGNCGPLAPCIREGNRTMRSTGFSYN